MGLIADYVESNRLMTIVTIVTSVRCWMPYFVLSASILLNKTFLSSMNYGILLLLTMLI